MIDQHWHGRVYTFANELGQDLVSLYPPRGKRPRPPARVYVTSGPYCPIDDPEAVPVPDVDKWMERMNAEGFAFALIDSGLDLRLVAEHELVEA
jgi:hypothetical protein